MGYYGFIYLTTNHIDGKKYIGQRVYDKRGKWKSYLGSGVILKKAIKKYGKQNFHKEILFEAPNKEMLDVMERYIIAAHNAVASDDYYNIAIGGEGNGVGETHPCFNRVMSEEERLKRSGKNGSFYGKHHSDEFKEYLRSINKGKTLSKETRDKISQAHKGKHLSEESRYKLSLSLTGKQYPERASNEWKTKMQISHRQYGKQIMCIETNKIYDSINQAERELGYEIQHALSSKTHAAFGMHYIYYTTEENAKIQIQQLIDLGVFEQAPHRNTPQKCICVETGIVYDSLSDAAKSVNGCATRIRDCLNNKRSMHKGYHWKRYTDC